MAIGKLFKTLTYAGVNSGTYGVYITGAGVYNAPARDVEEVEIPGRNGVFIIDNDRFQQIEVTYPAAIAKGSETEFLEAITNFRNAIASKVGYHRLEDDYNPDEYRQAAFFGGIEVSPNFRRTGEFDLTFSCKPQRFLKTGETAVAVASGGTITNPTLFEAHPLVQFTGGGTVSINGVEITSVIEPIGDVVVYPRVQFPDTIYDKVINLQSQLYNPGDTIRLDLRKGWLPFQSQSTISIPSGAELRYIRHRDVTGFYTSFMYSKSGQPKITLLPRTSALEDPDPVTFTAGTASSATGEMTLDVTFVDGDGGTHTVPIRYRTIMSYIPGSEQITIASTAWFMQDPTATEKEGVTIQPSFSVLIDQFIAGSSVANHDKTIYIDFETGESYFYNDHEKVPNNKNINIGTELATLAPGGNPVTYSSSISDFMITPRWWRV